MSTTTHTNDCVRQRAKFGARSRAGDVCSCDGESGIPEIVRRALTETVVCIGQVTEQERRTLEKYVRRGWLSKGQGGPFPKIKTVYAFPGFDFNEQRQRYVDHMVRLCELDREAAVQRKLKPEQPHHRES